jgi:hypothetical protein
LPSAQKAASIGFVHSKADNSRIKGKVALRSIHKYLQKSIHIQLQFFAKCYVQRTSKSVSIDINKRSFRSLLHRSRTSFSSLAFGSITLKNDKGKGIEEYGKEEYKIEA